MDSMAVLPAAYEAVVCEADFKGALAKASAAAPPLAAAAAATAAATTAVTTTGTATNAGGTAAAAALAPVSPVPACRDDDEGDDGQDRQRALEIVFYDVETTIPWRRGERHEILEFAAVVVAKDGFFERRCFSSLVRPSSPQRITRRSVECNGIEPRCVEGQPSFAELADVIYDLMHGRVWAGHNIKRFDNVRIRESYGALGRRAPEPVGVVDTLDLIRDTFGKRAGDLKMASLGSFCGLGKQAHRSLEDVRMNIAVVKQLSSMIMLESKYPDIFPSSPPTVSSSAMRREAGLAKRRQSKARDAAAVVSGTATSSASAAAPATATDESAAAALTEQVGKLALSTSSSAPSSDGRDVQGGKVPAVAAAARDAAETVIAASTGTCHSKHPCVFGPSKTEGMTSLLHSTSTAAAGPATALLSLASGLVLAPAAAEAAAAAAVPAASDAGAAEASVSVVDKATPALMAGVLQQELCIRLSKETTGRAFQLGSEDDETVENESTGYETTKEEGVEERGVKEEVEEKEEEEEEEEESWIDAAVMAAEAAEKQNGEGKENTVFVNGQGKENAVGQNVLPGTALLAVKSPPAAAVAAATSPPSAAAAGSGASASRSAAVVNAVDFDPVLLRLGWTWVRGFRAPHVRMRYAAPAAASRGRACTPLGLGGGCSGGSGGGVGGSGRCHGLVLRDPNARVVYSVGKNDYSYDVRTNKPTFRILVELSGPMAMALDHCDCRLSALVAASTTTNSGSIRSSSSSSGSGNFCCSCLHAMPCWDVGGRLGGGTGRSETQELVRGWQGDGCVCAPAVTVGLLEKKQDGSAAACSSKGAAVADATEAAADAGPTSSHARLPAQQLPVGGSGHGGTSGGNCVPAASVTSSDDAATGSPPCAVRSCLVPLPVRSATVSAAEQQQQQRQQHGSGGTAQGQNMQGSGVGARVRIVTEGVGSTAQYVTRFFRQEIPPSTDSDGSCGDGGMQRIALAMGHVDPVAFRRTIPAGMMVEVECMVDSYCVDGVRGVRLLAQEITLLAQ